MQRAISDCVTAIVKLTLQVGAIANMTCQAKVAGMTFVSEIEADDDCIVLVFAQVDKRIILRVDGLKAAGAQSGNGVSEIGQVFNFVKQVDVPVILIPIERFAAKRVTPACQADLIAVIDAGRARIGHQKSHCQVKALGIFFDKAEEAGHVVAVEQIELRVGELFGVNLQQLYCSG